MKLSRNPYRKYYLLKMANSNFPSSWKEVDYDFYISHNKKEEKTFPRKLNSAREEVISYFGSYRKVYYYNHGIFTTVFVLE